MLMMEVEGTWQRECQKKSWLVGVKEYMKFWPVLKGCTVSAQTDKESQGLIQVHLENASRNNVYVHAVFYYYKYMWMDIVIVMKLWNQDPFQT